MLIAPIDHNKEPDPDKHISRISSPYWTLPSNGGLGSPQNFNPSHSSQGIILRARDTRLMERRKHLSPPELPEQERRQRNNRKHDARWDTASHHILVIALERKAGEPSPWKAGDRVSVVPKTSTTTPHPQDNTQPDTRKPPLLVKDEGDYVLHLSKDYPPER
ncbi:MAG: hypothetical protein H8E42_05030 [Nitrospinae bacterium]|nr:hypothetical protein [Nitrospinota bacterium]MBL7019306.1 hypothetical protein [Nitrospinaceae bacterium]